MHGDGRDHRDGPAQALGHDRGHRPDAGECSQVGRFDTDKAGYAAMLAAGRGHGAIGERVWAVEGCNGIGRHIAHRLVHDGERVVDVPPKLSAQVRVFATGNGRKTDPVDAHSVALAALYAPAEPGLRPVVVEDDLVVMGMMVDRRDELGRARTQTVNRLHRLLLELIPGGAKTVPVRAAGPRAGREGQAARPRRQDPAPARRSS